MADELGPGVSGEEEAAAAGAATEPQTTDPETAEEEAATGTDTTVAEPGPEPGQALPGAREPSRRRRFGGKALALGGALAGMVLSAVVGVVVSNYSDGLVSRGDLLTNPGLHANSEIWWDPSREVRTVRMPGPVDVQNLQASAPDTSTQLDGLVKGGGVFAGEMRVRLTLMNFSKSTVVVTGLKAHVVAVKPTPAGPAFSCGGAQGGTEPTRVRIDLGSTDKAAEEYDGKEIVGRYPTAKVQLSTTDDPAIFDVQIAAGEQPYEFTLEASYLQGDKKGVLVVDDGGKPFVLAPAPANGTSAYVCAHGGASATWDRR